MRSPSIAGRIGVVAATAAAVTALVGAAAPLALLGLRLATADLRTAERLAAAVEDAITRERAEESTLEDAAREVLDESADGGARIEVWGPSGLVVARGPGPQLGPWSTDATPRRRKGRVIVRRHGPSGLIVTVAMPVSLSRALRREMGTALLLVVLPLSVLSALISIRLARRALAPLETLAQEVAARDSNAPWTRLAATSNDTEVVRLTDALNGTGARLTQVLAAEREFATYAAHALRTPLTRLVAESHAGPLHTTAALATLHHLVESLLLLVRADARLGETGATVNVADLLRHVAAAHGGSPRAFAVDAPDEVLVRGDEELLIAALDQLVENALAYSSPGTRVHLSAREGDGVVTIAVRDEGPGVADRELERIFDPFVRGRGAEGVAGSGLGLALVRRIAAGHGGSARAVPAGTGTCFEVRLPAWTPHAS